MFTTPLLPRAPAPVLTKKVTTEWPGWRFDRRLTDVYTQRLTKAFAAAVGDLTTLVGDWWQGRAPATRQDLANLASTVIERSLAPVLRQLWQEAWYLGERSADSALTGARPDWGLWRPGDIDAAHVDDDSGDLRQITDAVGSTMTRAMGSTRMDQFNDAVADAIIDRDLQQLTRQLPHIFLTASRPAMIASTEVSRAVSAAALSRYRQAGVTHKTWATSPGKGVCPLCARNAADGAVPLDALFSSGHVTGPAHPNDRCSTMPVVPGITAEKRRRSRRRRATLLPDSQSSVYHSEPGAGFDANNVQQPPNPSGPGWGGGGQQMHPHDAQGIQYAEDVPGSSQGTEPPRWDYGMAGPGGAFGGGYLNSAHGVDLWPQGGIGTEQPPDDWTNTQGGRNPSYPEDYYGRPDTDLEDGSEPHPREDDEDEEDDLQGDGRFPGRRGRPPNAVGKSKRSKPWKDTSIPIAERIYQQLAEGYPSRAIAWIRSKAVRWDEPAEIPLKDIDFSNEDSWTASKEPKEVEKHTEKMRKKHKKGKHGKPVVLIKSEGNPKLICIDGHHRLLSARALRLPVWGYCGHVSRNSGPWLRTHQQQDVDKASPPPSPRTFRDPVAAGILIRAADTHRILLIQRALTTEGGSHAS